MRRLGFFFLSSSSSSSSCVLFSTEFPFTYTRSRITWIVFVFNGFFLFFFFFLVESLSIIIHRKQITTAHLNFITIKFILNAFHLRINLVFCFLFFSQFYTICFSIWFNFLFAQFDARFFLLLLLFLELTEGNIYIYMFVDICRCLYMNRLCKF